MVGTGYVGLVTGVCFANTGQSVCCLDVDEAKIESLRADVCPIYEPGLTDLMVLNRRAGRLKYTTDTDEAYTDADMIFICVGTPTGKDGRSDLSQVWAAADAIADAMIKLGPDQNPKVVVVKSTVPVGTTLKVRDRIRERVGPDIPFHIANNPEFLKEGAAVNDFNKPDRVVCGVENAETEAVFRDVYAPFVRNGHPVYMMDILSSEMVKYASNNFLATKISFINEMAELCEAYGADIENVRTGMCSDKRIGNQFLYPGLGYGGSCFPKDTLACIAMGLEAGQPAQLSQAVHDVNQRQRDRFFERISAEFDGDLVGKKLAFWGLAFKPHTDDVREAPALTIARKCIDAGATVCGYDPVAAANAKRDLALTGHEIELADSMYDAVQGAHALVICTDWDEFKAPDLPKLRTALDRPIVFDGRNLLRATKMAREGFIYHSVGRAPVSPAMA